VSNKKFEPMWSGLGGAVPSPSPQSGLHVLVIPSWYPTADSPARGSFFREQALALARVGQHRVGVLAVPSRFATWHGVREARRAKALRGGTLQLEWDRGMPTYRMDWWGLTASLAPWRRLAVGLAAFDQYVREQGPVDVLHAHGSLYGGFVASHIHEKRHVPFVLTEHASAIASGRLLPSQRRRAAYAMRAADRVVAVGDGLARAMRELVPGVKVQVIGNSVNTEFFRPAAVRPSAVPFRFAVIAALQRHKRLSVLLDAFAALPPDPAELWIAGQGPERGALERQSDALGLSSRVRFLGAVSRQGVLELLQRSHALVSASALETFGVTLIEGMCCGLPVVAARAGGPEGIVTPETGILVPPDDVPALASALGEMRRHYTDFDPDIIRTRCVERFGDRAIVSRLTNLYNELVRPASAPRPNSPI
jgi:glycosyltransferase involved in cell wall biosynthesis